MKRGDTGELACLSSTDISRMGRSLQCVPGFYIGRCPACNNIVTAVRIHSSDGPGLLTDILRDMRHWIECGLQIEYRETGPVTIIIGQCNCKAVRVKGASGDRD